MNDQDVGEAWRSLEETYSQMSEEELGELAAKSYELSDIAQQALQAQLSSRGLPIEIVKAPPVSLRSPDSDREPRGNLNPTDLDSVRVTWTRDAAGADRYLQALEEAGIPAFLEVHVRDIDRQKAYRTVAAIRPQEDEDGSGEAEPEVVAWAWDGAGANPFLQALSQAGIPACLEVRVRDIDRQKAYRAISPVRDGEDEDDFVWDKPYVAHCPKCHSEEIVFEEMVAAASATGSGESKKFRWRCDACGHEWVDDGVEEQSVG